jgi:O-antigen/teichoic acid export membrane protein
MNSSASTGKVNLATNALVNFAGFAVGMLVTLWLAPILIHSLGDRRYGIWALVESVLAYLMLFDLGVAASVVRYVAKFEAARDTAGLNRVFSTSICIFLAAGACILAASGLCALAAGHLLDIPGDLLAEARWLLLLLGFNLALGLPLSVFPCVLDGLGRYPAKTGIRTVSILIRVPLFLAVLHHQGGLLALAWVITGLNLLEHLALAAVVRHYLPGLRFSFTLVTRPTFRSIRGYSADAFLAMIAGRISFQTDALVISAFLAPEYIAFFAVAGKLVDYAKTAVRTMTTVLTPAISTLEARGDLAAIRRVLLDSTRYVLWLILPIQLGLLILGKPFLTVWLRAPVYAALSYPTLVILALPLSLALSQSVSGRILYGMGRLRWFSRLVMGEALVNLLLSVCLVGPLGIEGVAWGTTIPNIFANVITALYVCRSLGVGPLTYLRRAFLAPGIVASLLGGGWLAAAGWFNLATWPALLAVGSAGLGGYMILALTAEGGFIKMARWLKARRKRCTSVVSHALPLQGTPHFSIMDCSPADARRPPD